MARTACRSSNAVGVGILLATGLGLLVWALVDDTAEVSATAAGLFAAAVAIGGSSGCGCCLSRRGRRRAKRGEPENPYREIAD